MSNFSEPLDAIGNPELRAALLYVRASRSAVSADDAAAALGVHRTVARRRLERLARAGLLETRFERRSGRSGPGAGRPAKLYSSAPDPEQLEFPPRRFAALVSLLLDELPRSRRPQTLRRVGAGFGRDLARTAGVVPAAEVEAGLERACAAVRGLGFHASLERFDGETALIATATCPLRPLVAERLEAAEIDRGMWAALVGEATGVSTAGVRCETQGCLETGQVCSVVLKLRPESRRLARLFGQRQPV